MNFREQLFFIHFNPDTEDEDENEHEQANEEEFPAWTDSNSEMQQPLAKIKRATAEQRE